MMNRAARIFHGKKLLTLPETTMLASLCYYIAYVNLLDFQTMNVNSSTFPSHDLNRRLERIRE
jgi:folate-dependent tRNA-U54 methylase TrmFO/GidA